jgi:PTS system nitrogen regulatory IIA component
MSFQLLLHLASSHFSSQNAQLNIKSITECLQDREKLGSTGLGVGVAIPHGRLKGLKEPIISFYRLLNGIDFKTSDQIAVDIVIFLLVPELATQKHLDLLSEIAQILADKLKRVQLREANTTVALRTVMAGQAN